MASLKLNMGTPNVSSMERWISAIAGGTAAIYGLSRGISRRNKSGLLLTAAGAYLLDRGLRGKCMLYDTLGVNTAQRKKPLSASVKHGEGVKYEKSVIIQRPAGDLYSYWRNFENLPAFMKNLKHVKVLDSLRSHWVAEAPGGLEVEWDAVIHNEKPNELIAWRTVEGSEFEHAGTVEFNRFGRGNETEVKVIMNYRPPAGKISAVVAKIFGEEPSQQMEENLYRFKQLMETGRMTEVREEEPFGQFERSKK